MLRKDIAFIRIQRVRKGQGKPRKTLKLGISVSRPGKSWNLIVEIN